MKINWRKYNYFGCRQFIGHGGYGEVFKVAYPLIAVSASYIVMTFADRLLLAHASTDFVAAALPVGTMYFTLFCFFSVTANFTSALVAQFFGAGKRGECIYAAWNGFYFALAASVLIMVLNPVLGKLIIDHSGIRPELIAPANDYLRGLWLSGVFTTLAMPLWSFYSGRGITWPVAVVSIGSCLLNIVLDYMLIFGRWGAPCWGIYGGGIATTIAGGFGFICALFFFLFANQRNYPTRKLRRFKFDYIKKIVGYGTPAGVQVFLEVGSFSFMTFLVGGMSRDYLAATTIALSVNNFSFSPLMGLSDATAIVVGQYIGRGRTAIAERVTYRAWRMSLFYMVLCSIVYLTCPEFLANLFAPDESGGFDFQAVVDITAKILVCAAVFNMFDAVKYIFMGGLRGAGDTRVIFLYTSGMQWLVMIPGLIWLIRYAGADIMTIWIFLTCCFGIEGLLITLRFRSGKWKRIKLINRAPDAAVAVPGAGGVQD